MTAFRARRQTVRQKDPLRVLDEDERAVLLHLSRSARESAAVVARAKAVLAVAAGVSSTAAPQAAGRRVEWRGLGGTHAAARRGASGGLFEHRARAYSEGGATAAGARGRRDGHLVVGDPAAGAAPRRRRLASGEYLHDLVRAQRRG